MKLNPTTRVILSNTLIVAALAAIWFGYGPLLLIVALAAHMYLYRMMTPRIPEFTRRGHPLILRGAWYVLVVSLAAAYFAAVSELLTPKGMRIYACIVIPVLVLGCFLDDVRYARKIQREPGPLA